MCTGHRLMTHTYVLAGLTCVSGECRIHCVHCQHPAQDVVLRVAGNSLQPGEAGGQRHMHAGSPQLLCLGVELMLQQVADSAGGETAHQQQLRSSGHLQSNQHPRALWAANTAHSNCSAFNVPPVQGMCMIRCLYAPNMAAGCKTAGLLLLSQQVQCSSCVFSALTRLHHVGWVNVLDVCIGYRRLDRFLEEGANIT